MKRRLPWILFILSLILNVALIGGAIYVKGKAEHYRDNPEARAEYIVDRLELSDGQRDSLVSLMAKLEELRDQREDARDDFRERFLAMLAQPELTREDVAAELHSGTDDWIDAFAEKTLLMHGFVQELTPEQREALFSMAREKRGGINRLLGGKR